MQEMRNAKSDAERQRIREQHMESMQQHMQLMRGGAGPGMMGQRQGPSDGGQGMGNQPKGQAGGMGPRSGGAGMDPEQRLEMMEQRMEHMQLMMEQMLEHQAQSQRGR